MVIKLDSEKAISESMKINIDRGANSLDVFTKRSVPCDYISSQVVAARRGCNKNVIY